MHACGHDLHTAGLVGAARLLSERRSELRGDVVFMFQPGEEGWDGAGAMIAEGVLEAAGRRADAAYGVHVFANMLPLGMISSRPGPLMAASSGLYVTVRGAGGHGSRPHAAVDPIVVAAEIVTALQTMVTRRFDLFDPVVITVGTFHAGTRRNIIPETATFEATVRTLSEAQLSPWSRHRCVCASRSPPPTDAGRRSVRARVPGDGQRRRRHGVRPGGRRRPVRARARPPAGQPGDGFGGLQPGAGRGSRLLPVRRRLPG